MQKRVLIYLSVATAVIFYFSYVQAAIQFLPRYQSSYGIRDNKCASSYKYSCRGTGYSGGKGTSCGGKYQSCNCTSNYKWSGGKCISKTCSDYGYLASKDTTKSCTEKTPRTGLTCYSCTNCDSSYKYDCSSISNASGGDGSSCGGKYQKCTCQRGYYWDNGKCVKSCSSVCSKGSLSVSCSANQLKYAVATTGCGETCYSCRDKTCEELTDTMISEPCPSNTIEIWRGPKGNNPICYQCTYYATGESENYTYISGKCTQDGSLWNGTKRMVLCCINSGGGKCISGHSSFDSLRLSGASSKAECEEWLQKIETCASRVGDQCETYKGNPDLNYCGGVPSNFRDDWMKNYYNK